MIKQQFSFILVFLLFCFASNEMAGQCQILDSAIAKGPLLRRSTGGTANRCGLVFNPDAKLYYSVNAGSSNYPADTYNEDGKLLDSTQQGFDYRGAWWNPVTSQFEGNALSPGGIFSQTLTSGTSYPSGSGSVLFTSSQPADQSIGDLDIDNYEIIYYDKGFIHHYDRKNNGFQGQYLIKNLPVAVADINTNSVVYTGCKGREIGIYDFTNRRLLFVDKQTGNYSGASQIPDSAANRSSFGVSYANGLFWVFFNGNWSGYQVLGSTVGISENTLNWQLTAYPNPTFGSIRIDLGKNYPGVKVEVFNIRGQKLRSSYFASTSQVNLDLETAGLYFIDIRTIKGESARLKVLKQ